MRNSVPPGDAMKDHELRIFRRILNSLASIREDIHCIPNQQEAQRQHDGVPTPAPVLRAELQIPERTERANQANSDRDYRAQKWLTRGTWLAFLAAAAYAGIAECTRRTMVETVNEARHANELTKKLLRGTYAAVLHPDIALSGDVVSISFTNSGKVISGHLDARGTIVRKVTPTYRGNGRSQPFEIKKDQIAPFPDAGAVVHNECILDGFSEKDRDLIWHDKEVILSRAHSITMTDLVT
jgi:hypothetical protein